MAHRWMSACVGVVGYLGPSGGAGGAGRRLWSVMGQESAVATEGTVSFCAADHRGSDGVGGLVRAWIMAALFLGSLWVSMMGGGLSADPPYSDELSSGFEARRMGWEVLRSWFLPPHTGFHETTAEVPVALMQRLMGSTVEAGRAVQAILGALLVVATFGIGTQLGMGDAASAYAAVLLSVNHIRIQLSRLWLTGSLQGAVFMALALWVLLSIRSRWRLRAVGVGVLAGYGMQNYRLAHLIPVLMIPTILALRRRWPVAWWKLAAVVTGAAGFIGLPWMLWHIQDAFNPQSVEISHVQYLFNDDWVMVKDHAWKALALWWTGGDEQPNYGATIPALDVVVGAAFAVGLVRLLWCRDLRNLVVIWLPVLMLCAMVIVNNKDGGGTSYYRLPMPLVFVSLVAGWGLAVIPRIGAIVAVPLLALSTYNNLHYRFVQYLAEPHQVDRPGWHAAQRICAKEAIGNDVARFTSDPRWIWLECPAVGCTLFSDPNQCPK